MNKEDSIRVNCTCGNQIHSLQMDMFDDVPDSIVMSISYYPISLWAKIKQFVRWVMGYDSLIADVIISQEDMDELIHFYFSKLDKRKS